jgi:hypothetical protein
LTLDDIDSDGYGSFGASDDLWAGCNNDPLPEEKPKEIARQRTIYIKEGKPGKVRRPDVIKTRFNSREPLWKINDFVPSEVQLMAIVGTGFDMPHLAKVMWTENNIINDCFCLAFRFSNGDISPPENAY